MHVLFAQAVPKKGLAHENGSQELLDDLQMLGYHEVILRRDGEPAPQSVQEEVEKRREAPAILGYFGGGRSPGQCGSWKSSPSSGYGGGDSGL